MEARLIDREFLDHMHTLALLVNDWADHEDTGGCRGETCPYCYAVYVLPMIEAKVRMLEARR